MYGQPGGGQPNPGSMWDMHTARSQAGGSSMWDMKPPSAGQGGPQASGSSMWDRGPAGVSGQSPATGRAGSMWDQQRPRSASDAPPERQRSGSMWDMGPGSKPVDDASGGANQSPALAARATPAVMGKPTVGGAPMGLPLGAPVPPGGPPGQVKTGTIKSYSVVKGFGFILCPGIPQDIYFGRDNLQAELRSSDVAGTEVQFELVRAADGKPQARFLRPVGRGTPAPLHGSPPQSAAAVVAAAAAALSQRAPVAAVGGCFPRPGMVFPGRPPFMARPLFQPGAINPLFAGRPPGTPLSPTGAPPLWVRPGLTSPVLGAGGVGGVPGVMGKGGIAGVPPGGKPSGDRRRDWSPHAGSRAIRQCTTGPQAEAKKSEGSRSVSSSRRSSPSSSSPSKSRSRSRKRKRRKKKKSKEKSRSPSESSTISSSSSSKHGRKKDAGGAAGGAAGGEQNAKESPEIQKAKMEVLEKLKGLQSIEPKETRTKQFRDLLRTWHPDKNPDNLEVATAVFQFLQKGKSLLNLK